MIIKTRDDNGRTKYYKATSNGRALLGSKGDAADFAPELAAKVLEQLKTIDHRFAEAELVNA